VTHAPGAHTQNDARIYALTNTVASNEGGSRESAEPPPTPKKESEKGLLSQW